MGPSLLGYVRVTQVCVYGDLILLAIGDSAIGDVVLLLLAMVDGKLILSEMTLCQWPTSWQWEWNGQSALKQGSYNRLSAKTPIECIYYWHLLLASTDRVAALSSSIDSWHQLLGSKLLYRVPAFQPGYQRHLSILGKRSERVDLIKDKINYIALQLSSNKYPSIHSSIFDLLFRLILSYWLYGVLRAKPAQSSQMYNYSLVLKSYSIREQFN